MTAAMDNGLMCVCRRSLHIHSGIALQSVAVVYAYRLQHVCMQVRTLATWHLALSIQTATQAQLHVKLHNEKATAIIEHLLSIKVAGAANASALPADQAAAVSKIAEVLRLSCLLLVLAHGAAAGGPCQNQTAVFGW